MGENVLGDSQKGMELNGQMDSKTGKTVEGLERVYVPVCPSDRLGGPLGYKLESGVVTECPIVVDREEYLMSCELMKIGEACGVLENLRTDLQPPDEMDGWSERDERLYHALNMVLDSYVIQRRIIDSIKLVLSTS